MSLPPHHRPFGDSALLVELDDLPEVLALDRALNADRRAWVSDIIPAARTLLVRFDIDVVVPQLVSSWIEASLPILPTLPTLPTLPNLPTLPAGTAAAAPPRTVEIPVRYDGADLAEVARLTGLTVDQVIAHHGAGEYTAAFCGFAPGFAYLTGLPAVLRVPRRDSPRERVPAGAVALADDYTAVYPRASPGGWQLIGSTDLTMFDVDRDPPVLLAPGTRVRFVRFAG